MSTKDDSGPAFPVADLSKTQCSGMTLRDYFAGQSVAVVYQQWMIESRDFDNCAQRMAEECYMIADAMLKARGQ